MNAAGSVLLDTNVVVAHFRSDPDTTARIRMTPVLFLPWVVLGELHFGALKAERTARQMALIREFRRNAAVLLPDEGTSEVYGEIKAELSAIGKPIPDNDIWIAALARQFDLPLVTRDAHFAVVQGLTIVRW